MRSTEFQTNGGERPLANMGLGRIDPPSSGFGLCSAGQSRGWELPAPAGRQADHSNLRIGEPAHSVPDRGNMGRRLIPALGTTVVTRMRCGHGSTSIRASFSIAATPRHRTVPAAISGLAIPHRLASPPPFAVRAYFPVHSQLPGRVPTQEQRARGFSSNTQRGVRYDSQGPRRSVIGRALRCCCVQPVWSKTVARSKHLAPNDRLMAAGEAEHSSRLIFFSSRGGWKADTGAPMAMGPADQPISPIGKVHNLCSGHKGRSLFARTGRAYQAGVASGPRDSSATISGVGTSGPLIRCGEGGRAVTRAWACAGISQQRGVA